MVHDFLMQKGESAVFTEENGEVMRNLRWSGENLNWKEIFFPSDDNCGFDLKVKIVGIGLIKWEVKISKIKTVNAKSMHVVNSKFEGKSLGIRIDEMGKKDAFPISGSILYMYGICSDIQFSKSLLKLLCEE